MMTHIKRFWPLLAAALSAVMATFQALGRQVSTGYFNNGVEVFLTRPFEGGVPSIAMTDVEVARISEGFDSAMMTLLLSFRLFALAAIGFAALYAFRFARERVERLTSVALEGEVDRACPFCAETIEELAVFCGHCNRDLESTGAQATRAPGHPMPGKTRRTWGIVLLSIAAFSVLMGASDTIVTIVLFVLIPVGFGLSLVIMARMARLTDPAVQLAGADQTSGVAQIKTFLSSRLNLFIIGGALALVLLVVVGTFVVSAANETAQFEAAAMLAQEEKDAAEAATIKRDALALDEAMSSAETSLADAATRYAESVSWSNDSDRQGLQDAAAKLQLALDARETFDIILANQKVRTALNKVGTLGQAQDRVRAAEKAAADAAAKKAAEAAELGVKSCDDAFAAAARIPTGANADAEIAATGSACSGADEWWSTLKDYPSAFGINSYPESDRWIYFATLCSIADGSPVCDDAERRGLWSAP
jgi:hypothetical protein